MDYIRSEFNEKSSAVICPHSTKLFWPVSCGEPPDGSQFPSRFSEYTIVSPASTVPLGGTVRLPACTTTHQSFSPLQIPPQSLSSPLPPLKSLEQELSQPQFRIISFSCLLLTSRCSLLPLFPPTLAHPHVIAVLLACPSLCRLPPLFPPFLHLSSSSLASNTPQHSFFALRFVLTRPFLPHTPTLLR